jgi:GNAT superfamily N-acetyltransferase
VSAPRLRDATEDDLDLVFDLAHRLAVFEELDDEFVATPAQYRAALFGDEAVAKVLIAELDGEAAGFALWFPTFSTFLGLAGIWLEDLFVDEAFRRRGVAAALLAELTARSQGRVEWEVLEWNQGAISLYEQTGAKPFAGWIKYRVAPTPDGTSS